MIAFLTPAYWSKRALKARTTERRKGWNWAAGELLAGVPVEDVRRYLLRAYELEHDGPFDEGGLDAIKAWEEISYGVYATDR